MSMNCDVPSFGSMCKYLDVVTKLACPSDCSMTGNDAPFLSACVASACLNQCADTCPSTPILSAALNTIRFTCLSVIGTVPALLSLDWNTYLSAPKYLPSSASNSSCMD